MAAQTTVKQDGPTFLKAIQHEATCQAASFKIGGVLVGRVKPQEGRRGWADKVHRRAR
jgi:hypothetical protein